MWVCSCVSSPPADEVAEETCGGAAGLITRTPPPDRGAGWMRMVLAGARVWKHQIRADEDPPPDCTASPTPLLSLGLPYSPCGAGHTQ